MRRALVVGNWKMHGSRASVAALLDSIADARIPPAVDVALCPAYVHLQQAVARCGQSVLTVGAQDCSEMKSGAFTGDVSAEMIADLGCQWTLVGHSERRHYHADSDDRVAAKRAAASAAGLQPIVCVGESREQREQGDAVAVVQAQLLAALAGHEHSAGIVVAYEPVWAIGTGLTATPEQAQDMHAAIRSCLAATSLDGAATRILYGGSVKADNAAQLFACADIDGALVGGAALVAEEFLAIVNAAS